MRKLLAGALIALFAPSLSVLVLGSAVQGLGTGVAGVMVLLSLTAQTMARRHDLI